MRLLRTIGGLDVTGQERAALNKLTMPFLPRPSIAGPSYAVSASVSKNHEWRRFGVVAPATTTADSKNPMLPPNPPPRINSSVRYDDEIMASKR